MQPVQINSSYCDRMEVRCTLPVQSVPNNTKVVRLNPVRGEVLNTIMLTLNQKNSSLALGRGGGSIIPNMVIESEHVLENK